MFVKRFIAKDMQEAIKKIRSEFGPDAVIIDSKAIRNKGVAGLFQKKKIEVVAAFEPDRSKPFGSRKTLKSTTDDTKPAKKEDKAEQNKMDKLGEQLSALQDAVEDFSNKIRIANKETTLQFDAEILEIFNTLIEQDVHEELAKEIAAQVQNISGKKSMDTFSVTEQLIMERFGDPATAKLKKFKRNVLMFAGPTGAGKTTTLAKLAGMFSLSQNLNVGLINMDTYRVGAMEHIKIYADIMDVPLLTAYNAKELKEAVKAFEDRDVVLIDTAGKTPGDIAYQEELQGYIEAAEIDDVYLVISVVTGLKACRDVIDRFSFLQDYKLIITKLDETDVWGNALNIADYAKKAPAYITQGQNVPDDIRETDIQKLAQSISKRGVL